MIKIDETMTLDDILEDNHLIENINFDAIGENQEIDRVTITLKDGRVLVLDETKDSNKVKITVLHDNKNISIL